MTKFESILEDFENAVDRLAEVLEMDKNEVIRDSAIQRFEFSIDLAWKTIKAFLEENKGIICRSPKECLREAYQQGIIEYGERWLKFVDMRNETAHTYKEELAEEIYSKLPEALQHFKGLLKTFRVK